MTDCSICLCKNGKIYRELGCGHRFHHKCLLLCQTKTCPLCRTPYENIVLRKRILSSVDELKFKIFCSDIKFKINSISETPKPQNPKTPKISNKIKSIVNVNFLKCFEMCELKYLISYLLSCVKVF